MTTVAANRKVMAADSQVSWEFHKGFQTPKIFRIDNSLYGLAGDNWGNVFIEWAKDGFNQKKKPDIGDERWADADFDVLELAPSGLYLWDKHLVRVKLKDNEYAIGSGSKFAILAMRELGYDPKAAVELACKYDDYTKAPIDVESLKDETTAEKSKVK